MDDDAPLCRGIADLYNRNLKKDEVGLTRSEAPIPDYEIRYPTQFRQIGLKQPVGQHTTERRLFYRVTLPGQNEMTIYRIHQWYYKTTLDRLVIMPNGLDASQISDALAALEAAHEPATRPVFPNENSARLTKWPNLARMKSREEAAGNPFIAPAMSGPDRDTLFQDGSGYVFVSSQVYPLPAQFAAPNLIRVYRLENDPPTVRDLCYLTLAPSAILDLTTEK